MLNWFEEHSKVSWGITILIALIIFYISSLTFGPSSNIGSSNSKAIIYHIGAFFFLGFFLLISLVRGKLKGNLFLVGILSSIAYGILDEVHQFFVPGRYCSLVDVALDLAGVLLAALIYFILIKLKMKKVKKTI